MMLTLRSRLAASAGLSALGVVGFVIAHRVTGSAVEAVIAVAISIAAAPAMGLSVGESVSETARDSLARQARFAPTLVGAVIAACLRAGTLSMAAIGAKHGASGIALVHGRALMIAGMWCCLVAFTIAVAGSISEKLGAEAGIADRLMTVAFLAEVVLCAALFAGPRLRTSTDLLPWVAVGLPVAVIAFLGRARARVGIAPYASFGLSIIGLLLAINGVRP